MDNAAKALMIAGGILLSLLIITMAIYAWQQYSNFMHEAEQQKEMEEIIEFNREFESYKRQALRGVDVLTVINKIRNNNKKNMDVQEQQIIWKIDLRADFGNLTKGINTEATSGSAFNVILNNKELLSDFKSLYFKCTSLKYSSKTKKVNEIVFTQYIQADNEFFKKD